MDFEGKLAPISIIFKTDVTLGGLELGLMTMQKGEFSRFLFQPQYAFGEMGCPPFIPAAAVVLYEVQVLDFLDSGQVDDFIALSLVWKVSCVSDMVVTRRCVLKCFSFVHLKQFFFASRNKLQHNIYDNPYIFCLQEEQNTVPLSTLLDVVNTLRSFGNRCFNQSRYDHAKDRYKQVNLDVFLIYYLLAYLIKFSCDCMP